MPQTGDIKRRIKSVNSINKITKAMEMVAAAKMRRAIEAVLKTRTYANLSWETVLNLAAMSSARHEPLHPLLAPRSGIKKVAIVLVMPNRGLCGSLASALLAKVRYSIDKHLQNELGEKIATEFILLGRKGEIVRRYGYEVAADFAKADLVTDSTDAHPVFKLLIDEFLSGKYDKVLLAYTDFINAVKQRPQVKQLLPINLAERTLGVMGRESAAVVSAEMIEAKHREHVNVGQFAREYLFEPDATTVLDNSIPKLIQVQLYQAMLEANASEHSARMAAMHQASQAASDMAGELTMFFNKARQASITAEIAEISAGANALS